MELKLWIPVVIAWDSGFLISCMPCCKAQASGYNKQNFPRFRIPQAKINRIEESGFRYRRRNNGSNLPILRPKTEILLSLKLLSFKRSHESEAM